jgi:hypothetical protein
MDQQPNSETVAVKELAQFCKERTRLAAGFICTPSPPCRAFWRRRDVAARALRTVLPLVRILFGVGFDDFLGDPFQLFVSHGC